MNVMLAARPVGWKRPGSDVLILLANGFWGKVRTWGKIPESQHCDHADCFSRNGSLWWFSLVICRLRSVQRQSTSELCYNCIYVMYICKQHSEHKLSTRQQHSCFSVSSLELPEASKPDMKRKFPFIWTIDPERHFFLHCNQTSQSNPKCTFGRSLAVRHLLDVNKCSNLTSFSFTPQTDPIIQRCTRKIRKRPHQVERSFCYLDLTAMSMMIIKINATNKTIMQYIFRFFFWYFSAFCKCLSPVSTRVAVCSML